MTISGRMFCACIQTILSIEKLRDEHFKTAIEPYIDGTSIPVLGDDITEYLLKHLELEMCDTDKWISWWLYETTRGKPAAKSGVKPIITINGDEVHLNHPAALYKLLIGKFDNQNN